MTIGEKRTVEHNETKGNSIKAHFIRNWHHNNHSNKTISLDEMMRSEDGDIFDMSDSRSDLENSGISEMQIASFVTNTITEQDREILKLCMQYGGLHRTGDRRQGRLQHSQRSPKRIAKLATAYADFATEKHGEYLDTSSRK